MKEHININEILEEIGNAPRKYHEFLRTKDLSTGIYKIGIGEEDPQLPHEEDEVYFIQEGKSKFMNGESVVDVKRGDFLFVPARVVHRFFDVQQDMVIVVFFGPAESNK